MGFHGFNMWQCHGDFKMVIFSGMKMVVYYGLMGFSGDYKGSKKKKTGMLVDIPSGKHTKNWKSAILMGKSTISTGPLYNSYNSYVAVYQRVTWPIQ